MLYFVRNYRRKSDKFHNDKRYLSCTSPLAILYTLDDFKSV